jgi:hypothetical protein
MLFLCVYVTSERYACIYAIVFLSTYTWLLLLYKPFDYDEQVEAPTTFGRLKVHGVCVNSSIVDA